VDSDTGEWVHVRSWCHSVRVHKTDAVPVGEAVEYFTRLIRRDAGNPDHYLRRSLGLNFCGRPPLALADCDQAVRLAPADARAWLMRGYSWYWNDDPVKALGDLTEGRSTRPDRRLDVGRKGAVIRLRQEFERLSATTPRPFASTDVCRSLCGAWPVEVEAGHAEGGPEDYEAATRLDPESALLRNRFGPGEVSQWVDERSDRELHGVHPNGPNSHEAWVWRGYAHDCLGMWEAATADYTQAIRLKRRTRTPSSAGEAVGGVAGDRRTGRTTRKPPPSPASGADGRKPAPWCRSPWRTRTGRVRRA